MLDEQTRNSLIERHLPLVRAIAQKRAERLPAFIELNDLVQSGVLGLMAAIDAYDPEMGASLETFASWRILGAILDSLRKRGGAAEELPDEIPSTEVSVEEDLARRQKIHLVHRAVRRLPARGQKVIELRYTRDLSMEKVGAAVGVGKTRAIQLHRTAIGTLQLELKAAA